MRSSEHLRNISEPWRASRVEGEKEEDVNGAVIRWPSEPVREETQNGMVLYSWGTKKPELRNGDKGVIGRPVAFGSFS